MAAFVFLGCRFLFRSFEIQQQCDESLDIVCRKYGHVGILLCLLCFAKFLTTLEGCSFFILDLVNYIFFSEGIVALVMKTVVIDRVRVLSR